jgi:hypothetical protein
VPLNVARPAGDRGDTTTPLFTNLLANAFEAMKARRDPDRGSTGATTDDPRSSPSRTNRRRPSQSM